MVKSLDYFTTLVQHDSSIPLFEAALIIAHDTDPQLDLGAALTELDQLGGRLIKLLPPDASSIQKLRLLNHFFYRELGFGGNINDYYEPDNSYLHRVIATRRGIPISLAIIYMDLAQQIGLDIKGISFPGHFLMKLSVQSGDIIIDPLQGSSLSREDLQERLEPFVAATPGKPLAVYLQAAPPRDILVRMLRNLKAIFQERQQWQALLGIEQHLLILLPDDLLERRDRGLTFAHLECPQAALQDLEAYLAQHPHAPDAELLRLRLPPLREASRRLN